MIPFPKLGNARLNTRLLAAGTHEPVADDARHVATKIVVAFTLPDGAYGDAV